MNMILQQVTEEGLAATRGVLYLMAVVGVWAVALAVRTLARAASALFKVLLVMIAIAALGAAALAIVMQVALTIGQG